MKRAMNQTAHQRRQHIGVLVKMYPKLSETFILEEILGLERLGISLSLYSLTPSSDAIAHPDVARVKARCAQLPAVSGLAFLSYAYRHCALLLTSRSGYGRAVDHAWRRGVQGLKDLLRAGWLAYEMRRDGVMHLHSHFISEPADIADLVSRILTIPFSISAHAKDIYLSAPDDLRRRLESARFTVTCTRANLDQLSALSPVASIHRLYHGVDHQVFHPSRRRTNDGVPLIVSVGRLRIKKGLDCLIDACAILRDQGQPLLCVIVGYGEEHDRLCDQIAELSLDERIRLAGKLTREQVIEAYARASVYVQPARIAADGDRDGIPNVLLEAMAMGLPVVASAVSGIPELVNDGINGLLVPPDDPGKLAQAIMRVIQDPGFAQALGEQARIAVIESFDNDRNLPVLRDLFEAAQNQSFDRTDTQRAPLAEKSR